MAEWEEAPKRNKANLKLPDGWEEAPRKKEADTTYGRLATGVGLATGDFASQALSMIPAGISGLYSGAKEWYKTGSLDKGIEASVAQTQHDMEAAMPSKWIPGYEREMKLPNEIFAAPAEAGTMAMRGIGGLAAAATGGVDAGVAHIKEPWRTPVQSALEDTVGVLGGYGLAHKGLVKGAKAIPVRGEKPTADPALGLKAPEPTPPSAGPTTPAYAKYRTRKEEAKIRKAEKKAAKEGQKYDDIRPEITLEPMEPARPEPKLEPLQEPPRAETPGIEIDGEMAGFQPPTPTTGGSFIRNNRTGEKMPLPRGWEEAPKKDGTIDYELPEKPLYPTDQRPEVGKVEEGVIEDANRAKEAEAQAIEDAKPKLDEPMEYGLTLEEPDAIRGAERERDRDALYEGRKTFPTEDIDLKLEKAEKDTHLKNKVKELENLEREIKEAKRKAGEEATEGSRVRAGEVGRTKKSQRETAEADNLIREREKKRDKVREQITARLENRHRGIDIRVNVDSEGRPTLSLYESDSKVKSLPEKTEFEVSPKTKELMDSIEFTRDKIMREIERTTPPDMQRSPEVPEQPRSFEKSMGNKERGAVNPEMWDNFEKKGISSKGKINRQRGAVDFNAFKGLAAADKKKQELQRIIDNLDRRISDLKDSAGYKKLNFSERMEKLLPLVNEKNKYQEQLNNIHEASVQEKRNSQLDSLKGSLDDIVSTVSKGKPASNVHQLNRGPGGKQSGGINLGIGDKLDRLLGRARTAEQMRKDLGYDTPPKPQRTKTHADAIRSVLPDENRTVEQFIAEEKKNFESWEDIPDTVLNKAIQPNAVGALSYRYNPLIRYMSSKLDQIDNKIKTEKENALWGSGFKQGLRGWSKRIKSDEGARTILDTLPAQKADGVRAAIVRWADGKELIEMGLERPSEQMLRDAGLDDRQIKSANAIYDQFDKGWDRLNELAKQLGLEPIAKRPGYFPSLWEGDYRIFVHDAEGKPIETFGAQTKWGMDKIAKEMKEKHPEYRISVADASRNKYKMNDTNAFRLALDLLDKDSPEAKILQATYKDIVAHRGFKTHGLEKRGAGGFLGSKEGIQGVKDFERAIDIYFDKMYKFIGEMEKKVELENLKNGMKEAGKPVSHFKNTNDFLNEMTANSTGAIKNQVEFINNLVEGIGQKAGIGESSVGRGINNLSGVAGVMWLTTVKFFEVQMLQPVFNLAKAREIKGVLPEAGDPYANFLKAYGETIIPGMASKDTKAGLSWAKQNGAIDAKILDLMGTNLQKGIWAKMVLNELPKHSLGWWEQEVVRTPAFILYNNMLRNVIKEPTERYAQAAALTQKYMINYSRTQSPSVYSKLGLVGDAARPLKQYSHGYAGQLSEYTARAVHDKQYAPLAHFLGIQWTLAGAKGLVALTGASVAINALNKYANTNIPTPEEAMLGSGLSDTMTFGPVSTITGQDLSGSLSSPDPTQMGAFPGLDWAGKALSAGVDLASKEMQGLDTDAERMKAMQSVTPNQLQGVLEDQFTEPGEGVPNPNNRMIPDRGPRTDKERLIRNLTGARALTEASDQAKIRAFKGKGQRLQKQKKHIMAKVLDEATRGEKNFEPLMKKWVDAGGDPAQWEPQIQQYLIDKNLSFINRELMKVEGLSGAEKVKRMEHFKMILEEASIDELVDVTQEFNK